MVSVLINVDVDDLAKATEFYTCAFDLKVGRHLGESIVELLGAPAPIYLIENEAGSATGASATRRNYARHWTPVHLDFVVEDLDVAVQKARAAAAIPEGVAEEYEWGRIATFGDPFGHGFCLLEFRGKGYDEMAEGD